MRLSCPRLTTAVDGCRLSVNLEMAPGEGETDLWVGVPDVAAAWLIPRLDPFVPAAALVAVAVGRDLTVDGPVDPVLLDGVRAMVRERAVYTGRPSVEVIARAEEPIRPMARRALLLYTRGIDSSHSLLALRAELDGLVYVAGLDPGWSAATHAEIVSATREAAAYHHLPLLVATSNLRNLVDPHIEFLASHHAVLGAVLLAMGAGVGTAYAAGGTAGMPAHWNWLTTSATRFVLHDQAMARYDKARHVAADRGSLRRLRVCYEADLPGNCGDCMKCLLSAFYTLAVADTEDVVAAFPPRVVDASHFREVAGDAISQVNGMVPTALTMWRESGCDRALRDNAERHPELTEVLQDLVGGFFEDPLRIVIGGDDPAVGLSAASRVAAAGVRMGEGPPLVIGWGMNELPLRPSRSQAESLRRACRDARPHEVGWAYVGPHLPGLAECLDAARDAWGPGLVHVWADDEPDARIDVARCRSILRRAAIRVWPGDTRTLQAAPLLSALEHGCLPVQVVSEAVGPDVFTKVPDGLQCAAAGISDLAAIDPGDRDRRMRAILGVVLRGSLERDMAAHLRRETHE